MKHYLLIFCLLLCSLHIPAQTRLWGTYFGGNGADWDYDADIVTDASGNIYFCSGTFSTNAIAFNAQQTTLGGWWDAYLVKMDSAGTVIWSTYFGGTGAEYGFGLAVDDSGNVYMKGITNSTSGIAYNGMQNTYGGGLQDDFLVKYNSGGVMQWSTYFGGAGNEFQYGGLDVDDSGFVYMTGSTSSGSGIALNGYQNVIGGTDDGYLAKFAPNGSLVWSTYFGGPGGDIFTGIELDNSGNIFVTGSTASTSGFAVNGNQNIYGGGGMDACLVKFTTNGSLVWSSYVGTGGSEMAHELTVDQNGDVYICGIADSQSVNLCSNGFQTTYGGGYGDGFLMKYNSSGSPIWSTFYGGLGCDTGNDVAVDGSGRVYLCGSTDTLSGNIALNGFQNTYTSGYANDYLVKFSSSGIRLQATYYGSTSYGTPRCDAYGQYVYLFGNSDHTTGIAAGGHQNSYGGGSSDAYVVKFGPPFNETSVEEHTSDLFRLDGSNIVTDHFSLTSSRPMELEVIDITGRVLMTFATQEHSEISVAELNSGSYWIKMKNGSEAVPFIKL